MKTMYLPQIRLLQQSPMHTHTMTIVPSLQEAADCTGNNLASIGTTFAGEPYPEQSLANARQLIVEAIEHLQVHCPGGMHEKPMQYETHVLCTPLHNK